MALQKRLNGCRCHFGRGADSGGPKEPLVGRGPNSPGRVTRQTVIVGHAQIDLPTVDILNLILKAAAAVRHLATSTVATCVRNVDTDYNRLPESV